MKHTLDAHLISNDNWELDYIKRVYGIGRKLIRLAKKETGTDSRKVIYKWLIDNGHAQGNVYGDLLRKEDYVY